MIIADISMSKQVKEMSLVPIIYTSLILFFGLLSIVIAISYLLFKTRKKMNPLIEQEIIKHNNYIKLRNAVLQQHMDYNKNIIAYTQALKARASNKGNIQSSHRSDKHPANDSYSNKNHNNHQNGNPINNEPAVLKNHYKEQNEKPNKRNEVRKDRARIEIMNNSSKFKIKQDTEAPRKSTKNFQTDIAEFNVLNFYSDSSEFGLKNITTPRNAVLMGKLQ